MGYYEIIIVSSSLSGLNRGGFDFRNRAEPLAQRVYFEIYIILWSFFAQYANFVKRLIVLLMMYEI